MAHHNAPLTVLGRQRAVTQTYGQTGLMVRSSAPTRLRMGCGGHRVVARRVQVVRPSDHA